MSQSQPPKRGRGSKKAAARSPLFDELLFALDREEVPGAQPLVSYDEGDDPEFLAAIEECATEHARLERRGVFHGEWAELDLSASGVHSSPAHLDRGLLQQRWTDARPIVLRDALDGDTEEDARELYAQLRAPQGLGEFLAQHGHGEVEHLELSDERDLAKLRLGDAQQPWLKSARLSPHDGDESLRLRVSFGEEVEDDAARDDARHFAVTALAEELLPGAARISAVPQLRELTSELMGGGTLYTQHIAYWNAPQGGALFHHDAFDEEARGGQRGVLYVQLSGRTAWLALSVSDLAQRVTEFAEALDQGEADWVRRALWPDRHDFERLLARTRDQRALLRELALPGCGIFAGLVNQGPDFTSFLADAGHGFLMRPGDALLMPNHGLENTVMHSVFCADEEPTYALSMALREA